MSDAAVTGSENSTYQETLRFFRFALVGVGGFFVDAGVLYLAIHYGGANHYVGRVISYLAAATFTWSLNRKFTFNVRSDGRLLVEWAKFLGVNALGGLLNYGVYALLVTFSATVFAWPVLGVAAGSATGLIVNFMLSRRFVFSESQRSARAARTPPVE